MRHVLVLDFNDKSDDMSDGEFLHETKKGVVDVRTGSVSTGVVASVKLGQGGSSLMSFVDLAFRLRVLDLS